MSINSSRREVRKRNFEIGSHVAEKMNTVTDPGEWPEPEGPADPGKLAAFREEIMKDLT